MEYSIKKDRGKSERDFCAIKTGKGGKSVNRKLLSRLSKRIRNSMIEFLYKLRYRKENITLSEIFDTETITKFHHISITLRYLYIESYFSNNESGIDLYRNAHKNYYKYFKKYYDEEKDIKEFNSLIESIRNKGYDKKSAVYFDCNGNLYNGAHRVAICTYLGINSFTGYRINKDSNPLSPEECYKIFNTEGLDTILQNKYREIIENIQR